MIFSGAIGSSEELVLTWTDNSDNELGFRIERSQNSEAFVEVGRTATDIAAFIDETTERGVVYEYRVNAFNDYGSSGYTNVASSYLNLPPTIGAIENVVLDENARLDSIAITINDVETEASELSVSAASSNTELFDASGLLVSGIGTERNVAISPKSNASGVSTITVSVSDGELTSSASFLITVSAYVPPSIALAVDTIGSTARSGEPFRLSVVASDDSLVESVVYMIDDVLVGESEEAPFSLETQIANAGMHEVKATARLVGRSELVETSRIVEVGEIPTPSNIVEHLRAGSVDGVAVDGIPSYNLQLDAFTLTDENGQIDGASDSLRFDYLQVVGDASVTVKIEELKIASEMSVAGLMFRSALYGNAPQVSLLLDGSGNIVLRTRSRRAAVAESTQLSELDSGSGYVRITKAGTNIEFYESPDGLAWRLLETIEVDLGGRSFLGMALAAGPSGAKAIATFSGFEVDGELVPWTSDSTIPALPSGLIISDVSM